MTTASRGHHPIRKRCSFFQSQRAGGAFGLPFSSTWTVLTGPIPTSTKTAGSFSPRRAPSQCTVFAVSMATVPACTGYVVFSSYTLLVETHHVPEITYAYRA